MWKKKTEDMNNTRLKTFALGALLTVLFLAPELVQAQTTRDVPQSRMFRLGEGMVRIAEPGEIADTLNLWGDISAPGRYIVPRGTKLPDLISYARGPLQRDQGGGL